MTIFSSTIKQIMSEMARSHQDQQPPKMTTLEVVKHYIQQGQQDGSLYMISFRGRPTSVPRLKGIEHSLIKNFNPSFSTTPIGVYAYPLIPGLLSESPRRSTGGTFNDYMAGTHESTQYQVLKLHPNASGVIFHRNGDSVFTGAAAKNEKQINNSFDPFVQNYVKGNIKDKANAKIKKVIEKLNDPDIKFGRKWEIMASEAGLLNVPAAQTKFLRQNGIDYMLDEGSGTIHGNEPYQIVIINNNIISSVYADANRNVKAIDIDLSSYSEYAIVDLLVKNPSKIEFVLRGMSKEGITDFYARVLSRAAEHEGLPQDVKKKIGKFLLEAPHEINTWAGASGLLNASNLTAVDDEVVPKLIERVNSVIIPAMYANIITGTATATFRASLFFNELHEIAGDFPGTIASDMGFLHVPEFLDILQDLPVDEYFTDLHLTTSDLAEANNDLLLATYALINEHAFTDDELETKLKEWKVADSVFNVLISRAKDK